MNMNRRRHRRASTFHRRPHPTGLMVVLLILATCSGTVLAAGIGPVPAAGVGESALPPPGAAGIPVASPLATSRPDFGNGMEYTVLHASSFTPFATTVPLAYAASSPLSGFMGPFYPDATDGPLYHTQIQLPNGAEVTWASVILYDSVDTGFVTGYLESFEWGAEPVSVVWFLFDTGASFNGGHVTLGGNMAFPFVFRTFGDLDGDGTEGDIAWNFVFGMGTTGGGFQTDSLLFWGVILGWHRTVSPAPATATFSDVPTNHWAFQFVEALADSGVTAGCGGGNYCPDDPVTRGQMAVYLAAALGLHWPR